MDCQKNKRTIAEKGITPFSPLRKITLGIKNSWKDRREML